MLDDLRNIAKPTPLSVTQLNRQVRLWLEQEAHDVRVIGELSNFSQPASGHWYFTLKDETAQIRCVFFRTFSRTKLFKNGDQVIAEGKLSLYEARGDYQLIVATLEEAGLGELFKQFEELKKKLELLGLFAAQRKKNLPKFPLSIAVISSQTGAALQDILTTLARRFPLATVYIYHSEVQGKQASKQLKEAILRVNQHAKAEVIILARGGGSFEDLVAFNDESLALTIAESLIPLVTGIGHETDFTIADFVADYRAATPTAAAESITPDKYELIQILTSYKERMFSAMFTYLQNKNFKLRQDKKVLSDVVELIRAKWQSLDYLDLQLRQYMASYFKTSQHKSHLLLSSLMAKNPSYQIEALGQKLSFLQARIFELAMQNVTGLMQDIFIFKTSLEALNPLATLKRGYAIANHKGLPIISYEQVNLKDKILIQLSKGYLECLIVNKGEIDA